MILAMTTGAIFAWIGIWILIACVSAGIYFILFWLGPLQGGCWTSYGNKGWYKWKWVIINHVVGIILAWSIWGIIYLYNQPNT